LPPGSQRSTRQSPRAFAPSVWLIAAAAAVGTAALGRWAPSLLLPATIALIAGTALAAQRVLRRGRADAAETEHLRTVARSARDIIWTVDLDRGRLTYVSPAVERILGWSPQEQLAQASFEQQLTPESNAHTTEILKRIWREGLVEMRYEAEHYVRSGGTVWLEVNIAIERDAQGAPRRVYGVSRDVSERKRLEASLARSNEALGNAQRMEALGQLTGGLAHDFNNLLTVILGSLEFVREALPPDEALRSHLSDATAAAERGAALTHQLLAFARRQPLRPATVDLRTLLADLSQMLSRTLGETIRLRVAHDDDPWPCAADPAQIENAILNLALNARHAMPRGGALTIATGNVDLRDDAAAGALDVAPGDYVVLAVSDTGEGMPPEVARRAFEPFFTTRRGSQGSGLGLSMVYGFARQSGGQAKLESRPGHGTTVRIWLPRATWGGEERPHRTHDLGDAWRAAGQWVLVVDDDDAVRHVAQEMLARHGCRTLAAADAHEALRLLERRRDVRVLLTDVVLPGGLDGFELAERAQKVRPELRVLFMSGYPESEALAQRLATGVPYLEKPFRARDLARQIRPLLEPGGAATGGLRYL
jgi:PAS domain S-box-containing protein